MFQIQNELEKNQPKITVRHLCENETHAERVPLIRKRVVVNI